MGVEERAQGTRCRSGRNVHALPDQTANSNRLNFLVLVALRFCGGELRVEVAIS